ncbi:response regulator receiver domain [Kribbella sp. NPDC056345]|uniref:response regulator receiver domain n=1 Tax=Kribbella sp. NPDC056345 TaxID=3345789 RepID=UPI0035DF6276
MSQDFAMMRTTAFLQTALVVDDEIQVGNDQYAAEEATLGTASLEMDYDQRASEGDEFGLDRVPGEDHSLDSMKVVESFADHGISCAVLQPRGPSPDDLGRVESLAVRSDIVVLDWLLGRSDEIKSGPGEETTSLGLVKNIVSHDIEAGNRLRLICIYTATPDLHSIVDRIGAVICDLHAYTDQVIVDHGSLSVSVDSLRILVVAKPHHSAPPDGAVCTEAELPARMIYEFCELAGVGLLPQLALAAISSIRDNAHRLLARFDRNLDSAFISHRAMTDSVGAEQFAHSLVSSEVTSLLSTVEVASAVYEAPIEARVEQLLGNLPEKRMLNKVKFGQSYRSVTLGEAREILTNGLDSNGKVRIDNADVPLRCSSTTSLFSRSEQEHEIYSESLAIDLAFGALSSLARTPEHDGKGTPAPLLRLGALLRGDDGKYLLCLQPLCDSVRLSGSVAFPLMPLSTASAESEVFDIVVGSRDSYVALSRDGVKLSDVRVASFDASSDVGMVQALWGSEDSRWRFYGSRSSSVQGGDAGAGAGNPVFEWVGDLRPEKANQIVAHLVTNLGRTGINEFEYLRRSGRK